VATISNAGDRASLAPIVLGPNQPENRPYRGGAGIARFRDSGATDAAEAANNTDVFTPEDFVASTTEIHAGGGVGLTILADGTSLRDAVIADPIGFLGEEHVRRFGAETMLLVKLLDTAERLFVHYHPNDAFAAARFSGSLGKTEAWVVIDAVGGGPGYANLGFSRPVSEAEVTHWVRGRDVDDMLGAMNRIELSAGDTLLVPAGLAHAIGPGLTFVELQQPTDLSILLEYEGYNGLTAADAFLGLDLDIALGALDRRAWDAQQLEVLTQRRGNGSHERLFPAEADAFFSAERLSMAGSVRLGPAFAVLIVLEGSGILDYSGGSIPLNRGMTILTPHGAGAVHLAGDLTLLRCRPPHEPHH
jgi:mannose-6-phosphate isomerase